jgi:glutaredoxin 3
MEPYVPNAPDVVIYTKPGCPYCIMAINLLKKKGVAYQEIIASNDPALRQEMYERSGGGYTFPQIFINGRHIGGCDDMHALDRAGRLDPLLQAA